MKKRFSVKKIVQALSQTFKHFPVEMGLIFFGFVICVLLIADVNVPHEMNVSFVPIFFALAYALNNIFSKTSAKRLVYYLCWLPIIPLWVFDLESWIKSEGFLVLAVCAVLLIFVCRWAVDNKRFAVEGVRYIINMIMALVFAGVAHLLIKGIYMSGIYIFDLEDISSRNFHEYLASFIYIVVAPTMLLAFTYNNVMTEKEYVPSKFIDILLNFIVTPAILIYTVILYAYFLKIAFTWSLPKGYLAYMIFSFIMVAIVAKAMQPLLGKRLYDWFYDRFSLISIPALIMFWVGVGYRLAEYGLTETRVYLLLCGAIMTATLVMFVCKSWGRYLWVTLIIMGSLALFTYIPPMSAKKIGLYSQISRVKKMASELNILDSSGNFIVEGRPEFSVDDSVSIARCSDISSSLYYIFEQNNKDSFLGLKSASEFRKIYPTVETSRYSFKYISVYHTMVGRVDVSKFSTFIKVDPYSDNRKKEQYMYEMNEDRVTIYKIVRNTQSPSSKDTREDVWSIPAEELLSHQLAKVGYSLENKPTEDDLYEHKAEFMTYVSDSITIYFSEFSFTRDGKSSLHSMEIDFIFMK